jgi:DNA repair photolyase
MARHIRYEPIRSKTILNAVKAPSMPFEWSINPYRGCQHGCSFCYARATHSFMGVEADDTFQNHIFVKENAAEALQEQLRKMTRSKRGLQRIGRVAIGTATDPYQPIEAKAQLTRQCLELLAEYRVPTSITTRSPLILRDIDLLRKVPITSINLSVNTLDSKVWRDFEPSTPAPIKRLETVRHLVEEGITAGIFLAPILPSLTDGTRELTEVIEAAARHKVGFVMASFLRITTPEVKSWFFLTLQQHYPHLLEKYAELYRYSGYLPKYYRESKHQTINELLRQFGLNETDPFPRPQVSLKPEPPPLHPPTRTELSPTAAPEQLSFTFDTI